MSEEIDTGSTSIHVGKTDKQIIDDLEWEHLGASKIFSRALKKARKFDQLQEEKERELQEERRKWSL